MYKFSYSFKNTYDNLNTIFLLIVIHTINRDLSMITDKRIVFYEYSNLNILG